jgi:hypothetical protein
MKYGFPVSWKLNSELKSAALEVVFQRHLLYILNISGSFENGFQ